MQEGRANKVPQGQAAFVCAARCEEKMAYAVGDSGMKMRCLKCDAPMIGC